MADKIGLIEFPPAPPGNKPIPDPMLVAVGNYVGTFLNELLSDEWSRLAPGEGKPVKKVTTASTRRAVFNTNALPTLFVFRQRVDPERISDDLYEYTTILDLLWVPPRVDEDKREIRDPFSSKVGISIDYCLRKGRHPNWVDPGDPDPKAATLGSVLMKRAGFTRVVTVKRIDYDPKVYVELPDKQQQQFEYAAVLVTVHTHEQTVFDDSLDAFPSKLEATIDQKLAQAPGDPPNAPAYSILLDR